jgi:3-phenylpropionate/trans-cinnamate dioxygenase ferredoxin subunit
VSACAVDDVDEEDVIPFQHNGIDYSIYRSPESEFFATAGHCTHEKTLLCDGLVMGSVIECPKHNGRFDYQTGRALAAPVIVDLQTFPVRVADGSVEIDIDG